MFNQQSKIITLIIQLILVFFFYFLLMVLKISLYITPRSGLNTLPFWSNIKHMQMLTHDKFTIYYTDNYLSAGVQWEVKERQLPMECHS